MLGLVATRAVEPWNVELRTSYELNYELNYLNLVNCELNYELLNDSAQLLRTMKQCAKPDSDKLKIRPNSYSLERKARIRPFSKNKRIIFKRLCMFQDQFYYLSPNIL